METSMTDREPPRTFRCPKCGGACFGIMMKKTPGGMVRDRIACHSLANGHPMSMLPEDIRAGTGRGIKPCGWEVAYSDDAPCWIK